MNAYFEDDLITVYHGDVLETLRQLPEQAVNCCVTSPPYFNLRDYSVDGQLGLESSPWEYIEKMVTVFREVRRVLRDDGTLWLNMGDSYAGSRKGGNNGFASSTLHGSAQSHDESHKAQDKMRTVSRRRDDAEIPRSDVSIAGLKPKDLVGMPWRLAFALQADGWWLRQDIIWQKPNPMPESVSDRCTKAHEYLFLMAKSERYYFNQAAISEQVSGTAHGRGDGVNPKSTWKTPDGWDTTKGNGGHGSFHKEGREDGHTGYQPKPRQNADFSAAISKRSGNKARKPASARGVPVADNGSTNGAVAGSIPWEGTTRNKRDVWTVGTEAFPEAHFATFPTELIKPCVLAGCPEGGTVLDPFAGSLTTMQVARDLHCKSIGIELNPEYIEIGLRCRLSQNVFQFQAVE